MFIDFWILGIICVYVEFGGFENYIYVFVLIFGFWELNMCVYIYDFGFDGVWIRLCWIWELVMCLCWFLDFGNHRCVYVDFWILGVMDIFMFIFIFILGVMCVFMLIFGYFESYECVYVEIQILGVMLILLYCYMNYAWYILELIL